MNLISKTMKKSQSSVRPPLKKHHRIKSQQIVCVSSQVQNVLKQSLNGGYHKQKNERSFHTVQINKPSTGQNVKVVIEAETALRRVKQLLCIRLGVKVNQAYFYSDNPDKSFEYCLSEGIGNLETDAKLKYAQVKCEKDEQGNLIQSNQIGDYFLYECLSVGGFSKVFLVRSQKSGKFYAAKFVDKNFDKSQKFKDLIYNQKYINEVLDYQLLVKMHKFIETESFFIFILDYCPSGQLFCLMKNYRQMTQVQAKFYFIETLLAIQYIHSKSVIYRDIKPQNILLDKNGHIKLADFGLSKVMREKSSSYCGSLEYMAPEIVLGVQHSFGVDHYCLGSLLFQIMIGCPPFYNPNFTPAQTKYHIANSQVKFPSIRKLSPQIIDLISRLLDKNPSTRLGSLGGIKQILCHPWIGRFDRSKYQNYEIQPPYKIPLNKSNFQRAFLPNQAINQIRLRIERQIQQKISFQKTKKQEDTEATFIKKNQVFSKYSTSCSRNKKVDVENPYQILITSKRFPKRGSFKSSKIFIKSEPKTFHQSNFHNKYRSLSKKFLKQSRLSHMLQSTDNLTKKQASKQNLLKTYLNRQHFKRSNNTTLHRKSGNYEKQNELKIKFEKKSKQQKEFQVKNPRGSLNEFKQDEEKSIICKLNKANRALTKAIYR